jgi:hypothetical protein
MTSALVLMAPMILQGPFAAPTLHAPIQRKIVGENQLRCTADVGGLGGATTATAASFFSSSIDRS